MGWLEVPESALKLHSGGESTFKIECDALEDSDVEVAALLLARLLPSFSAVEGVPDGGLRLARAMEWYLNAAADRLLIVDDVCTTGTSLEEHRDGRDAVGAVLFARGPCPGWVVPLFFLHSDLWGV